MISNTPKQVFTPYTGPQIGYVYVVSCYGYDSMKNKVLAVFKTAASLERFFKGARLSCLRYQGWNRPIHEIRESYSVQERKLEE